MRNHLLVIEETNIAEDFVSNFYRDETEQLSESENCLNITKITKADQKFQKCYYKNKKQIASDLNQTGFIDETAYSALELKSDNFLVKLMIIREQMRNKKHPLAQFISYVDTELFETYSTTSYEEAKNNIYTVLHLLIVSVIKFYSLEMMEQEMWKDLLLNLLINMMFK